MSKAFLAVTLTLLSAPALADEQLSVGTGFDYSSGKYGGTKPIDILYVPFVATYEADKLTLKLTVPYISITGAGAGIIPGLGRIGPATTGRTATTTASGLGDIVAAAGYEVYEGQALTLDLVGKVKFGTADRNRGLGTGMNDYSAQVDGYHTVRKMTYFATAGYKIVGVPPGTVLHNVAFGTIGASRKLNDVNSAGAMLDVAQNPSPVGAGPRTVTAYLSHRLSNTAKVQPYVVKGFSSGSPNTGFGVMITGALQ